MGLVCIVQSLVRMLKVEVSLRTIQEEENTLVRVGLSGEAVGVCLEREVVLLELEERVAMSAVVEIWGTGDFDWRGGRPFDMGDERIVWAQEYNVGRRVDSDDGVRSSHVHLERRFANGEKSPEREPFLEVRSSSDSFAVEVVQSDRFARGEMRQDGCLRARTTDT